jgi:hypothetical protein
MENLVIASVDDHIVESPRAFDQHVPADLLAKMPRYISDSDDGGYWHWPDEDKHTYKIGLNRSSALRMKNMAWSR